MVWRSRLEIYIDVLKAIDNGTDILTRIMYETNLSWISIYDVFDSLIKGDFIRAHKKKHLTRYYITEMGKNALSYQLKSLEGMSQATGISIDSVN